MGFDTFNAIKAYILERAQCDATGDDWDAIAEDHIVEAFRELVITAPWLCLRKYPPGALALLAPITNLTISAVAGTTAVTLSATYASSLADYIVIPSGADYIMRITAHTAGQAALTVDAVPEDIAAGTACTIVKIEYDLNSDTGIFVDSCFWTVDGQRIPVVKEDYLRENYPQVPQQAWPAKCAARVAKTRVRFSSYPEARKRLEYPYSYEPSDPSGATTLVLDEHLRPPLGHRSLALLLQDKREFEGVKLEEGRYARGLERAEIYEERLLVGLGGLPNAADGDRGYGS